MIGLVEIWRRKMTFGLIALVVALLAYLVIMINGLGLGLRNEFGSALQNFDATAIAFESDAQIQTFRSEISTGTIEAIRDMPGVEESAPIGYVAADYRDVNGAVHSASFFGYDPGTIAEPRVVSGRALSPNDERGLLVDKGFLEGSGLRIGDSVTVRWELREQEFQILGSIDEGSFGFLPAAYLLRESWQLLRYGSGDGAEVPAASIMILKGDGLAGQVGPGFEVVSKGNAFESIDGLADLGGTIWALRFFGYAIAAGVVGAFFYIVTLQKRQNIGLLKALGASNRLVAGQTLLQALAIMLLGLTVAVVAAALTGEILDTEDIGITFTTGIYATTGISLVITGLFAIVFSIGSILRVDPIIALAQQQ